MTLTKIVGGFCGALLIFLLGKWAAELVYHAGGHGDDHAQAYVIDTGADDQGEAEAEEGPSFAELFVNADVGKGERVFNKCKACHKLEEGANGTGPYLYGVVGRDVASANGFSYSGNLAPVADVWTPENLQHFLENPAGFAPGTTMGFAGLKDIEDRANLIAFLDQTDGDTYEIEMPAEEEAATEGGETTDEAAAEGDAAVDEAAADAGESSGEEVAADEGDASGEEMAQDAPEGMDAAEQMSPEQPEVAEVQPTPQAEAEAENVTDDELVEELVGDAAEGESAEAADAGTEEAAAETASDEQQPAAEDAAAEDAEQSGFGAMVAAADPAEGEKVFRKCKACHVADKEQNRVGPHLVGIVGRPVASVEDFRYSDAMQDHGGEWSHDQLDAFLADPKGTVPGTKMSFAGLKKEEDRASVVAYLESLN